MRWITWLTKHWSFLLVLLFGLTPLIWYKRGLIIAGGDNYYLLNPGNLFNDFLYTWTERINLGLPNLQTSQLFPLTIFWMFFGRLGFSLVNIGRLWSVLVFSLTGVSMYFLFLTLRGLFEKDKNWDGKWGAVIAATLYMFNMWVTIDVITPVARLVGALVPFFLLLWVKGLAPPRLMIKYPLLIGVSSLFLTSTYSNPVSVIAIPLSYFTYLVFFVLDTRRFSHAIKFFFLTSTFFLVFNVWWLLPYLKSGLGLFSSMEPFIKEHNFLMSTPIFEAFRFMGFWAFRGYDSVKKIAHVPYAHFYYEPLFLLIGHAVSVLALAALLFRPRDRRVIYFVFLGLIGVFFSKGITLPLGIVYKFFFENVPGFSVFREPFARFTGIQVLSFSVLLGISVEYLFTICQKYCRFWPVGLILVILLFAFPLLNGKVIQDSSWHRNDYEDLHVNVPSYWQELRTWLEENGPQARVLIFPRQPYVTCYRWSSGICTAGPTAPLFLSNPLLIYPEGGYYRGDVLLRNLYEFLDSRKSYSLSPLFDFFDIDYVLVQNDIMWEFRDAEIYQPEVLKESMLAQKDLVLIKSFGDLDLYEYSQRKPRPTFFISTNYDYTKGSSDEFLERALIGSGINPSRAYFFSRQEHLPGSDVLDKATTTYIELTEKEEKPGYQKYLFQIPQDGIYSLYGERKYVDKNFPKNYTLLLDNSPVNADGRNSLGGQWSDLGSFYLSRGQHLLEFSYQPPANLVSPGGFLNGSWVGGAEMSELEGNVPVGESGFWLLPSYPRSRISLMPLVGIKPGELYKISFWYKTVGGSVDNFGVQQNSCIIPLDKEKFDSRNLFKTGCKNFYFTPGLDNSPQWRFFETTFETKPLSQTALLFFEFSNPEANAYISSLKAERIFTSSFVVRNTQAEVLTGEPPRDLVYRKLNPAKYELTLPRGQPSSYEFIFNQSYNENWKAYVLNTKRLWWPWPLETFFLKPLPESQHFLVNGYANGWQVREKDVKNLNNGYEIIVEYRPQRLYAAGLLLLFGGLFLGLCYFVYKLIRSGIIRKWPTKT